MGKGKKQIAVKLSHAELGLLGDALAFIADAVARGERTDRTSRELADLQAKLDNAQGLKAVR